MDALPKTQAQDTATFVERRRPGRPAAVARQLLPLLRAEERALLPPPGEETSKRFKLDTGPGILLGVTVGGFIWAGLIRVGWLLMHAF